MLLVDIFRSTPFLLKKRFKIINLPKFEIASKRCVSFIILLPSQKSGENFPVLRIIWFGLSVIILAATLELMANFRVLYYLNHKFSTQVNSRMTHVVYNYYVYTIYRNFENWSIKIFWFSFFNNHVRIPTWISFWESKDLIDVHWSSLRFTGLVSPRLKKTTIWFYVLKKSHWCLSRLGLLGP